MSELQTQLDVETTLIAEGFEELLSFTIDSCLRNPGLYQQKLEEVKKGSGIKESSSIAHRIGLWPLREAVQLSLNTTIKDKDMEFDNIYGEILHTKVDCQLQLKVEALGKAILEEAFLCLGEEAPQKVVEWRAAETAEDRKQISNWLLKVVYKITGTEIDENGNQITSSEVGINIAGTEDDLVDELDPILTYHPIRLSPKYIGEYPNTYVEPTCLGVSILVSAFYERLGTPYLHAGVVRTAPEEARIDTTIIAQLMEKYIKDHGIDMHDKLELFLSGLVNQNAEVLQADGGFHASVFAQLDKSDWIQTDPYYKRNSRLWEWSSSELDQIYETLCEIKKEVLGTEVLWQNRSSMAIHNLWEFARKLAEQAPRDSSEIEDFLLNASPDITSKDFVKEFLGDFLEDSQAWGFAETRQVINDLCTQTLECDYKSFVEDSLLPATVFHRVFPDARHGDLSKSLARCKTDSRYLHDRIEDIKLLPLYTILNLQLHLANSVISGSFNKSHSTLELGLPAYKVGMSVLSHMAVWCGDKLPQSFWLTYWPSQVSFADHVSTDERSLAQRQVAYQTAKYIDREMWTYLNINGIVKVILDQGGAGIAEDQEASTRGADGSGGY